jgi:hypothetical protein
MSATGHFNKKKLLLIEKIIGSPFTIHQLYSYVDNIYVYPLPRSFASCFSEIDWLVVTGSDDKSNNGDSESDLPIIMQRYEGAEKKSKVQSPLSFFL